MRLMRLNETTVTLETSGTLTAAELFRALTASGGLRLPKVVEYGECYDDDDTVYVTVQFARGDEADWFVRHYS